MTYVQPEEPVTIPAVAAAVTGPGGARIVALDCYDIRFPTSRERDGSDAMNPDPDYSAAYVVLRTDDPRGLAGHGFVFTIGRGNDVQTAACAALHHLVVGRKVVEVVNHLGAFARSLTDDSQLRWLGPEKGVMHMAIGAVVNAANERAVAGFLAGELPFVDIVPACRRVLEQHDFEPAPSLDQLVALDAWARQEVVRWACAS